MEDKSTYYTIIPATVRYDRRLCSTEKLMYGEILALSHQKGYCWASNLYFSDLYEVSIRTISNWISDLKKFGYIDTKLIYQDSTKNVEKRLIYILDSNITEVQSGLVNTYGKKVPYPIEKNFYSPIEKKFQDNNINNNIINNNTNEEIQSTTPLSNKYIKEKETQGLIDDVVREFNEICGTKFRSNSSSSKKYIKARLKDGYSLPDFKKVILWKYQQWGKNPTRFSNGQMSDDYLRPSTLFGGHFEDYLFEANKNLVVSCDQVKEIDINECKVLEEY